MKTNVTREEMPQTALLGALWDIMVQVVMRSVLWTAWMTNVIVMEESAQMDVRLEGREVCVMQVR